MFSIRTAHAVLTRTIIEYYTSSKSCQRQDASRSSGWQFPLPVELCPPQAEERVRVSMFNRCNPSASAESKAPQAPIRVYSRCFMFLYFCEICHVI